MPTWTAWPLEFTTLPKPFSVSTFLPSFSFFFHRKLPLIAVTANLPLSVTKTNRRRPLSLSVLIEI